MAAFAEDERDGGLNGKGYRHNDVEQAQGIIGPNCQPKQEYGHCHPHERYQMPCNPQCLTGGILAAKQFGHRAAGKQRRYEIFLTQI